MKLTVLESPTTSQSILLKKSELQQDIFETKQNYDWDRKVRNREYSKANFEYIEVNYTPMQNSR